MPVVAVVGGERVEAWTFDAAGWENLRRVYKMAGLTMSCGQPGIPVRSPKGMFFFRHQPKSDCALHEGGDESQEHYTAKAIVAETARALGWIATVERRSDDGTWIADVLLEHDGVDKPVAVEIQWSRQSNEDFHRRQDRYTAAGVDCFWVAGPVNEANVAGVPSYPMNGTLDALNIELPITIAGYRRQLPFAEAVTLILNGLTNTGTERLSPYAALASTALIVETATVSCWWEHCGRPFTKWRLVGVSTESRCGQRPYLDLAPEIWVQARPEPAVAPAVTAALEASTLPKPVVLQARPFRSSGAITVSLSCPYCGRSQSEHRLAGSTWTRHVVPHVAWPPFRMEVLNRPHQCVNNGNGNCQPPTAPGSFPRGDGFAIVAARAPAQTLIPRPQERQPDPDWKTPAQRRAEAEELRRARERGEAEREKRRQERARIQAEKAAAEKQALRDAAITRCAQLEEAWPTSDLRVSVLAAHGGTWPEWLNYQSTTALDLPTQMWEAQLWNDFIRGRQHHTPIDPRVLCKHLTHRYPGIQDPANAVRDWLLELTRAGKASHERRGNAPSRMFWTIHPAAAQQERDLQKARMERLAAAEARREAARAAFPDAQKVAQVKCSVCDFPLHPIYHDIGSHPMCTEKLPY